MTEFTPLWSYKIDLDSLSYLIADIQKMFIDDIMCLVGEQ